MKKSRLAIIGISLPLISACSCSIFSTGAFSWDKYKNNDKSMSLQSSKFQSFKLEDINDNTIKEKEDSVKEVVTSKGSLITFTSRFKDLANLLYKIANSYVISTTKYYANSDSTYQAKASKYQEQMLNIRKYLMDLETDIYHSSKDIKISYFGGLSDEAIEQRLKGNQESIIEADYDKIFTEYQDEGSELYLKFTKDGKKEEYLDKGFDYLLRYVNKANELIDQIKYDNYLDYSYEYYYGRDYNTTNAVSFVNFVKQYFVPILKAKKNLTVPDNVDVSLLEKISKYNFCYQGTSLCDYFESYAEEMGGNYLSAYNNAFKYGYYCFTNSINSLATAYEWGLYGGNDAVLYFSRNYQDVLSVVHEFGHYYSCTYNNGERKNDAYDLQETYSQGNEFTFSKYLLEQKKDDPDYDTYSYYVDEKIYDVLGDVCREAAITEIELDIYKADNLTKSTLMERVNAILDTYEGTAGDTYFMGPLLASPCYYISYATSVMEAVQFANMESFTQAKNNYTKLVEADNAYSMVQRWEHAGLKSPFNEECFKTLSELFTSLAEKY